MLLAEKVNSFFLGLPATNNVQSLGSLRKIRQGPNWLRRIFLGVNGDAPAGVSSAHSIAQPSHERHQEDHPLGDDVQLVEVMVPLGLGINRRA
jgi:hypothetical protein